MEKITFRTATPEDVETIQKMHKDKLFEHGLSSIVELRDAKTIVALADGKIIGFTKFGKNKLSQTGFILRVEVLKGFQRKGIGKKFVAKAQTYFRVRGITNINIMAVVKAISFFTKSGYRTQRKFGTGNPRDVVADMGKTIKPRRRRK